MERSLKLALPLLLLPAVALAQDAGTADGPDAGVAVVAESIEATVTHATSIDAPIHAGQTVEVAFQFTHPAGATVTFPQAFQPDRWVLVNARREPGTDPERATTSTWILTFGVYRPGSTTLQPFDIEVATKLGKTVVQSQPIDLKVLSIFADATEEPSFSEPRPPVVVWVEDYTLAFVGGGALLFALFGAGAWYFRRRQLLQPPPPPPPRAPHEIALEKLSALAGGDLVEQGEYMEFWVRMSEAVREYLGRTYGFPGTELTTTEIMRALEPIKWPSGIGLADVASFLRRCDEVKFGGSEPGVEESTATLRRGFSIVELTKPRPKPAPAPPKDKPKDGRPVPRAVAEADESGDPSDTIVDPPSRWAPPADKEDA